MFSLEPSASHAFLAGLMAVLSLFVLLQFFKLLLIENPELIFRPYGYWITLSFRCQRCWNWRGMLILPYLFTQSQRKMYENKLLVQAKFRFIQLELIIIFI